MNKYHEVPDAELFDLLVKYTDEYTKMLKTDQDLGMCKELVDGIVLELKLRKKVPDSLISPLN